MFGRRIKVSFAKSLKMNTSPKKDLDVGDLLHTISKSIAISKLENHHVDA